MALKFGKLMPIEKIIIEKWELFRTKKMPNINLVKWSGNEQ